MRPLVRTPRDQSVVLESDITGRLASALVEVEGADLGHVAGTQFEESEPDLASLRVDRPGQAGVLVGVDVARAGSGWNAGRVGMSSGSNRGPAGRPGARRARRDPKGVCNDQPFEGTPPGPT